MQQSSRAATNRTRRRRQQKRAGNLPALIQSENDFRAGLKPLREGHGDGVTLHAIFGHEFIVVTERDK